MNFEQIDIDRYPNLWIACFTGRMMEVANKKHEAEIERLEEQRAKFLRMHAKDLESEAGIDLFDSEAIGLAP